MTPQSILSGKRLSFALVAVAAATSVGLWQWAPPATAATASPVPAAGRTMPANDQTTATAVLAGGCFWGMEQVFQHVRGVEDVVTGYAGGPKETANYADSSTGQTEQAESVRITYDPQRIRYSELLRIYFSVAHDPTQVDRQGPDVGHEYRSAIFPLNDDQARVARAYIQQLNAAGVYAAPIATEVTPLASADRFYRAEAFHQNYAARNPHSRYVQLVDWPKVVALKKQFRDRYVVRPKMLSEVFAD